MKLKVNNLKEELILKSPKINSKKFNLHTENITENQTKILSAIEQNPSVSQEGIAQVVGINRANVAKNLKKLVEMGLVKRIGPDRGGHWEVVKK